MDPKLRDVGNAQNLDAARQCNIAKVSPEVDLEDASLAHVRRPSKESGLAIVKCRSWAQALQQAHSREQILALPAWSLRGPNTPTRLMYTGTFAPSKCLWLLSVLMVVALGSVGVLFTIKCNFGPAAQLAEAMASVQLLLKLLSYPRGDKEDWPMYTLLRALEPDELENFLKDICWVRLLNGMAPAFRWKILYLIFNVVMGFHIAWAIYSQDSVTVSLVVAKLAVTTYILGSGTAVGFLYLWAICKRLTRMIKSHSLWVTDDTGHVDLTSAYEGFHGMQEQVQAVSKAFQHLFFVAEFMLVLMLLVDCFAVWDEMNSDSDSRVLRVGYVLANCLMHGLVMFLLISGVGNVTGAVHTLPERVHKLCAQIAVTDKGRSAEAQAFHSHVKEAAPQAGFQGFGLLISPGIVAKLAYSGLVVIFGVVSLFFNLKRNTDV
jgi:hypothetical protein